MEGYTWSVHPIEDQCKGQKDDHQIKCEIGEENCFMKDENEKIRDDRNVNLCMEYREQYALAEKYEVKEEFEDVEDDLIEINENETEIPINCINNDLISKKASTEDHLNKRHYPIKEPKEERESEEYESGKIENGIDIIMSASESKFTLHNNETETSEKCKNNDVISENGSTNKPQDVQINKRHYPIKEECGSSKIDNGVDIGMFSQKRKFTLCNNETETGKKKCKHNDGINENASTNKSLDVQINKRHYPIKEPKEEKKISLMEHQLRDILEKNGYTVQNKSQYMHKSVSTMTQTNARCGTNYNKNNNNNYKELKASGIEKRKAKCISSCEFSCTAMFSETDRDVIYKNFWRMNFLEKRFFIRSMVKCIIDTDENSEKIHIFVCFFFKNLKKVRVCEGMFTSTLGINANLYPLYSSINDEKECKSSQITQRQYGTCLIDNKIIEEASEESERRNKKIRFKNIRNAQLGPPCGSLHTDRYRCRFLTENDRQKIFAFFWKLVYEEKKQFLGLMLKRVRSNKRSGLIYHLIKNSQNIEVCKKMFISTLDITGKVCLECAGGMSRRKQIPSANDSICRLKVIELITNELIESTED